MKAYLIHKEDNELKAFEIYDFEDCLWTLNEASGVRCISEKFYISAHTCNKSALYDDLTYYTDVIQESDIALHEDTQYLVIYNVCEDDYIYEYAEVLYKKDIIKNIRAQKYVEGASYYIASGMITIETEEQLRAVFEQMGKTVEPKEASYIAFGHDLETGYFVQSDEGDELYSGIQTRNEAMLLAALEGIKANQEVKEW